MNREPEYIFENGKVYTMVDGRVVAAVKESEFEEQQLGPDENPTGEPVEMPDPPADIQDDLGLGADACPECQAPTELGDQYCSQCGASVGGEGGEDMGELGYGMRDDALSGPLPQGPGLDRPVASVVTPNGLKGQVLGKVAGMWGDEVTVRFENGRVVRLPVTDNLKFASVQPAKDEASPVDRLARRLAVTVDGTRGSLEARAKALQGIKHEAAVLIQKGASHEDEQRLDSFRVQADYELGEVSAALEHLASEELESYAPPAPFRMQAVEQESMGRGDGNWLDHTVNEMIAEAESTDYEKLMDEGPEAFVAELEDAPLADAGVVRQMASRFIQSHTAGANPEVRDLYEKTWLARVEEVRRAEFGNRKQAMKREAAAQETDYSNLPDDMLFS